jgi:hypothetical protein
MTDSLLYKLWLASSLMCIEFNRMFYNLYLLQVLLLSAGLSSAITLLCQLCLDDITFLVFAQLTS